MNQMVVFRSGFNKQLCIEVVARSAMVVALLCFTANCSWGCDEVLGICMKTFEQNSGALVTKVNGVSARNLRHDGESTRYTLIAGQHVIVAVNGVAVGTADECVEALKRVNGTSFSIDVYNIERGTTRTYISYSAGVSTNNGGSSGTTNGDGSGASERKNLVWDSRKEQWRPAPGYVWVNNRDHSQGVRWKANMLHPNHRGVFSLRKEGQWSLQMGYEWVSNREGDLRTRYVGIDRDEGNSGSDSSNNGGSNDNGFSSQDAWRMNNLYQHSPYNHWGNYGPRGY